MKKITIEQKVRLALVFSVISSLPVLMCALNVSSDKAEKAVIFIASATFWTGLLLEQCFLWLAASERRKAEVSKKKSALPGIISFFKTKLGKASDITFIISVAAFIIISVAGINVNAVKFIVLFLIVLSFRFHCITNGKNYSYKPEKKKRGAKS